MTRHINTDRVESFLLELDDTTQNKMLFLLRRLESGPVAVLAEPHGEKVGKDLYAIRIKSKTNPRIYYTIKDGEIVTLMGCYKKNKRIPKVVIHRCREIIKTL